MVLPLPPYQYKCTDCGWRRRTPGGSDVMAPSLVSFRDCPECGSKNLQVSKLGSYPYNGPQLTHKNLKPTVFEAFWRKLLYRR